MDTDGDGKASLEEFNQFRKGGDDNDEVTTQDLDNDDSMAGKAKLSAFASFDKDKDGFVTQEELNAYAKYSNPGNGTGELKAMRFAQDETTNAMSTKSQGKQGSENKGNKGGGNRGGGKSGGGNGNKGGKDK
ncbi:hypothetical protein [Vibrio galatheae]|uniref:hypothetical protein n=1 Tax=Vibrio galatheae TaxID=579748 RepID=UPI000ACB560F|nr:hypothetical protein [Vibrio galatheae]